MFKATWDSRFESAKLTRHQKNFPATKTIIFDMYVNFVNNGVTVISDVLGPYVTLDCTRRLTDRASASFA